MDMSGETRHRPHPHTTRHSFFTHRSEAGVTKSTLMTTGRHKSEAATSRYIGTSEKDAREAWDKYRDRIRGL
jgi:integrase